MTNYVASLLLRSPGLGLSPGAPRPYRTDLLAIFDDAGDLVVAFPTGEKLDVAIASVRHSNTGAADDLLDLLALEARDGNLEAANLLQKAPAPTYIVYQELARSTAYVRTARVHIPAVGDIVHGQKVLYVGREADAVSYAQSVNAATPQPLPHEPKDQSGL